MRAHGSCSECGLPLFCSDWILQLGGFLVTRDEPETALGLRGYCPCCVYSNHIGEEWEPPEEFSILCFRCLRDFSTNDAERDTYRNHARIAIAPYWDPYHVLVGFPHNAGIYTRAPAPDNQWQMASMDVLFANNDRDLPGYWHDYIRTTETHQEAGAPAGRSCGCNRCRGRRR